MTTEFVYKKISLWGTAWQEFRRTVRLWWPCALLVTGLSTAYLIALPVPALTALDLKQHPELLHQSLQSLIPLMILGLLISFPATYVSGMLYLRTTVQPPPRVSVGHFFFWLRHSVWRFVRPAPWLLLTPLFGIGLIFYLRSMLRYQLVTPRALLGHEPVLKGSWDLTKNNVWRLFWGALVLDIVVKLIILGVFLIPLALWAVLTHGDRLAPSYIFGNALYQGVSMGLLIPALVIYECVAYQVLQREQNSVASSPSNPATLYPTL